MEKFLYLEGEKGKHRSHENLWIQKGRNSSWEKGSYTSKFYTTSRVQKSLKLHPWQVKPSCSMRHSQQMADLRNTRSAEDWQPSLSDKLKFKAWFSHLVAIQNGRSHSTIWASLSRFLNGDNMHSVQCLLEIGFQGLWQKDNYENCTEGQEATWFLLPSIPFLPVPVSKNKDTAKGGTYPKSLIEVNLFIKSEDCRTDIQGTELHGGRDDGWPARSLSVAKKHSNSLHIGSCRRPLKDVPSHKPHRVPNVSDFPRTLIFYLGEKLKKLFLATVVRPMDEVAGARVVGNHNNSGSHGAITFPDVKVIDNRSDDVPHFIKSLLCDIVGLVQGKYQLCWIHRTLFYKNESQKC